jgi:UDP-N-acetyl-D-mannosaminuronic acid dehydrogenase
MSKLAENAFRDVNIAFANELSLISDRLGIDVWELIRLANHHPRVNILSPGCGVGGHCIAVDPWFIIDQAPQEARLIRAAREVNDHKPQWVLGRIRAAVDALIAAGRDEATIRIALFGLAFKPDIDDLRESPALQIVERLARQGRARLLLVEPNINTMPPTLAGHGLTTVEEATACADIIVFLVRHREFKGIAKKIGGAASIIDAVGMEAC